MNGIAAPSIFMRKLASYKGQKRPDFAPTALGRIERTLLTIDRREQPPCAGRVLTEDRQNVFAAALTLDHNGYVSELISKGGEDSGVSVV